MVLVFCPHVGCLCVLRFILRSGFLGNTDSNTCIQLFSIHSFICKIVDVGESIDFSEEKNTWLPSFQIRIRVLFLLVYRCWTVTFHNS